MGPPDSACSVRGRHALEARAGHHLAPAPLSCGRDVFTELGREFTLIALTGDDQRPAAAFQAAARQLGMPLRVITDTFDGRRAAYRRRLILVRPCQHVAWAGDDPPASAADILRRAAGEALPARSPEGKSCG